MKFLWKICVFIFLLLTQLQLVFSKIRIAFSILYIYSVAIGFVMIVIKFIYKFLTWIFILMCQIFIFIIKKVSYKVYVFLARSFFFSLSLLKKIFFYFLCVSIAFFIFIIQRNLYILDWDYWFLFNLTRSTFRCLYDCKVLRDFNFYLYDYEENQIFCKKLRKYSLHFVRFNPRHPQYKLVNVYAQQRFFVAADSLLVTNASVPAASNQFVLCKYNFLMKKKNLNLISCDSFFSINFNFHRSFINLKFINANACLHFLFRIADWNLVRCYFPFLNFEILKNLSLNNISWNAFFEHINYNVYAMPIAHSVWYRQNLIGLRGKMNLFDLFFAFSSDIYFFQKFDNNFLYSFLNCVRIIPLFFKYEFLYCFFKILKNFEKFSFLYSILVTFSYILHFIIQDEFLLFLGIFLESFIFALMHFWAQHCYQLFYSVYYYLLEYSSGVYSPKKKFIFLFNEPKTRVPASNRGLGVEFSSISLRYKEAEYYSPAYLLHYFHERFNTIAEGSCLPQYIKNRHGNRSPVLRVGSSWSFWEKFAFLNFSSKPLYTNWDVAPFMYRLAHFHDLHKMRFTFFGNDFSPSKVLVESRGVFAAYSYVRRFRTFFIDQLTHGQFKMVQKSAKERGILAEEKYNTAYTLGRNSLYLYPLIPFFDLLLLYPIGKFNIFKCGLIQYNSGIFYPNALYQNLLFHTFWRFRFFGLKPDALHRKSMHRILVHSFSFNWNIWRHFQKFSRLNRMLSNIQIHFFPYRLFLLYKNIGYLNRHAAHLGELLPMHTQKRTRGRRKLKHNVRLDHILASTASQDWFLKGFIQFINQNKSKLAYKRRYKRAFFIVYQGVISPLSIIKVLTRLDEPYPQIIKEHKNLFKLFLKRYSYNQFMNFSLFFTSFSYNLFDRVLFDYPNFSGFFLRKFLQRKFVYYKPGSYIQQNQMPNRFGIGLLTFGLMSDTRNFITLLFNMHSVQQDINANKRWLSSTKKQKLPEKFILHLKHRFCFEKFRREDFQVGSFYRKFKRFNSNLHIKKRYAFQYKNDIISGKHILLKLTKVKDESIYRLYFLTLLKKIRYLENKVIYALRSKKIKMTTQYKHSFFKLKKSKVMIKKNKNLFLHDYSLWFLGSLRSSVRQVPFYQFLHNLKVSGRLTGDIFRKKKNLFFFKKHFTLLNKLNFFKYFHFYRSKNSRLFNLNKDFIFSGSDALFHHGFFSLKKHKFLLKYGRPHFNLNRALKYEISLNNKLWSWWFKRLNAKSRTLRPFLKRMQQANYYSLNRKNALSIYINDKKRINRKQFVNFFFCELKIKMLYNSKNQNIFNRYFGGLRALKKYRYVFLNEDFRTYLNRFYTSNFMRLKFRAKSSMAMQQKISLVDTPNFLRINALNAFKTFKYAQRLDYGFDILFKQRQERKRLLRMHDKFSVFLKNRHLRKKNIFSNKNVGILSCNGLTSRTSMRRHVYFLSGIPFYLKTFITQNYFYISLLVSLCRLCFSFFFEFLFFFVFLFKYAIFFFDFSLLWLLILLLFLILLFCRFLFFFYKIFFFNYLKYYFKSLFNFDIFVIYSQKYFLWSNPRVSISIFFGGLNIFLVSFLEILGFFCLFLCFFILTFVFEFLFYLFNTFCFIFTHILRFFTSFAKEAISTFFVKSYSLSFNIILNIFFILFSLLLYIYTCIFFIISFCFVFLFLLILLNFNYFFLKFLCSINFLTFATSLIFIFILFCLCIFFFFSSKLRLHLLDSQLVPIGSDSNVLVVPITDIADAEIYQLPIDFDVEQYKDPNIIADYTENVKLNIEDSTEFVVAYKKLAINAKKYRLHSVDLTKYSQFKFKAYNPCLIDFLLFSKYGLIFKQKLTNAPNILRANADWDMPDFFSKEDRLSIFLEKEIARARFLNYVDFTYLLFQFLFNRRFFLQKSIIKFLYLRRISLRHLYLYYFYMQATLELFVEEPLNFLAYTGSFFELLFFGNHAKMNSIEAKQFLINGSECIDAVDCFENDFWFVDFFQAKFYNEDVSSFNFSVLIHKITELPLLSKYTCYRLDFLDDNILQTNSILFRDFCFSYYQQMPFFLRFGNKIGFDAEMHHEDKLHDNGLLSDDVFTQHLEATRGTTSPSFYFSDCTLGLQDRYFDFFFGKFLGYNSRFFTATTLPLFSVTVNPYDCYDNAFKQQFLSNLDYYVPLLNLENFPNLTNRDFLRLLVFLNCSVAEWYSFSKIKRRVIFSYDIFDFPVFLFLAFNYFVVLNSQVLYEFFYSSFVDIFPWANAEQQEKFKLSSWGHGSGLSPVRRAEPFLPSLHTVDFGFLAYCLDSTLFFKAFFEFFEYYIDSFIFNVLFYFPVFSWQVYTEHILIDYFFLIFLSSFYTFDLFFITDSTLYTLLLFYYHSFLGDFLFFFVADCFYFYIIVEQLLIFYLFLIFDVIFYFFL